MINISRQQLARYAMQMIADHNNRASVIRQMAAVLLVTGKAREYELLVRDIAYLLESAGLAADAKVTVAAALSGSQKRKLIADVKDRTGVKKVTITQVIDSSIIGGVRVDTALHSWDNTILARVNRLRRSFS